MSQLFHDAETITVTVEDRPLLGSLVVPNKAKGIIIFVHGSGSSRQSPRNQLIAKTLQRAGFATLLFDLLTKEEEAADILTAEYRFNIRLLTHRLVAVTDWISNTPKTKQLLIGYFGASTGTAAALLAASQLSFKVKAIVSSGGRPDLAEIGLDNVQAPTLLIVGGKDYPILQVNEFVLQKLSCPKKLVIVTGASHLFEEEGKLEEVAELSQEWFTEHLV